jgi:hypothetical protein
LPLLNVIADGALLDATFARELLRGMMQDIMFKFRRRSGLSLRSPGAFTWIWEGMEGAK